MNLSKIIKINFINDTSFILVLAQRGYFKDAGFVNYLKYLLYWKKPEYAKYLKYPMCLYFLDLLQYEYFRREVVNAQCCKFIDDQAILLWQHYTRRRTKTLEQQQHLHSLRNNPSASQQNLQNSQNGNQNGTAEKTS